MRPRLCACVILVVTRPLGRVAQIQGEMAITTRAQALRPYIRGVGRCDQGCGESTVRGTGSAPARSQPHRLEPPRQGMIHNEGQ